MHVFCVSTAYHGNDLIDKGEKTYQSFNFFVLLVFFPPLVRRDFSARCILNFPLDRRDSLLHILRYAIHLTFSAIIYTLPVPCLAVMLAPTAVILTLQVLQLTPAPVEAAPLCTDIVDSSAGWVEN
jgi:hypothetical protein